MGHFAPCYCDCLRNGHEVSTARVKVCAKLTQLKAKRSHNTVGSDQSRIRMRPDSDQQMAV